MERSENIYRLKKPLGREGWVGGTPALLMRFAPPVMEQAVGESRESAFLGIMTTRKTVKYIFKAVSRQEVRYDGSLLHERPAFCTSIGIICLADLTDKQVDNYLSHVSRMRIASGTITDADAIRKMIQDARRTGYAESRNGHVEGASGIAAGIRDADGLLVGAITLAAPTARFDKHRDLLISVTKKAAEEITRSFLTLSRVPDTTDATGVPAQPGAQSLKENQL